MRYIFARSTPRFALWACLSLATLASAHAVQNPNLPLNYGSPITAPLPANTVQRGTILMQKETAYQAPKPKESVEDLVERVTTQAIAASEARQNSKLTAQIAATKSALESFSSQRIAQMGTEIRQFSQQNTSASAAELRAFTEQRASAMAAELRQYASNNTQLSAEELRQYADDVAKRVSKQTVVAADPQVQDAIRKVVNLAIIEQDDPVRYSVERLVEERLARAAQDPIEASILRITQPAITEAEQRFDAQNAQQIAQMRQNTEDLLALYRSATSEQVAKAELNTANKLNAEQAARNAALSRLQSDLALQIQQQNTLLANYQATLSDKLSSQQLSQLQQISALQNNLTQELNATKLANASQLANERAARTEQLAAAKLAQTQDAANIKSVLNARFNQQQLALKDVRIDTAQSAAEQITQINALQNQLSNQLAALQNAQQQQLSTLENKTQLELANERQYRTEQLAAAEINRTREAANIQATLNQRLTQQQLALKNVELITAQNTAAQIAALENKTLAQINQERATRNNELEALRRNTDTRLATLAEDTRNHIAAVTQTSTNALENRLTNYAQTELNSLENRLSDSITSAARNSALTADEIRAHTANQLDVLTQLTEERIASVTTAKTREMEDRLVAYASEKAVAEANRVQISAADIEQIAGRTLAEAGDEIRALALQTIAESDDYIKTIAREAIIDDDPAMQTALNNAARKVITDGNDNVTFAIRAAVEDALNTLPPTGGAATTAPNAINSATPTIVTGEEIASANLKIGELQPVNAYGIPTINANGSTPSGNISLQRPRHRADWVDIRDYNVVVHEDNKTLEQLLATTLKRAEPFTGPWSIKWKISRKNQDILTERFSLDVETNFTDFIAYLAQYMVNYRGVQLTFSLFDTERTIVISD